MKNSELMVHICTNRKDDVAKLFTGTEVDLFDQNIRQAVKDRDKERGEETAGLFIKTFNERVAAYNENVAKYNMSILDGTHPALGNGIINDLWRSIKRIF